MPSNLTFDATNSFRLSLINRTLQAPNGPQTFTSSNYTVQNLSNYSNVDPGDVDDNRDDILTDVSNSNIYKPEQYFIVEDLNTYARRANLQLYPYFVPERHTLIGIMTTKTFDTESELFKFAASYISEERNGPVFSRIQQNLETATVGRFRLEDALNGNTTTAINILTGREPLIELNNRITVNSSLLGRGFDFAQTVAGVEFPFTQIPGDYLTEPSNPIERRPVARVVQGITGFMGTIFGVNRRLKSNIKPSDLFVEYMGDGQKRNLFDLLSYSKYGPNYRTSTRRGQTEGILGFVNSVGEGIRDLTGLEAPNSSAYIGDDRDNDVKYTMSDYNGNQVRGSYYMSILFDPIQAELFQINRNVTEGGKLSSNLTWISKNSSNKLGENNNNYNEQRSNLEDSLSTKFGFREDSILGQTQLLLDSMPSVGGEARSHVGNVIDQTSRVFREGDVRISRGSAVKYVDKFSGEETGVEYCRVWTKDRPYSTMSDTMKRTSNIRKFEHSVLGGNSRVWNINYAPMSNGNKSFDGSTNILNDGSGFYAKKFMFSIENLAWKSSNREGFTVQNLPYCERGPNGGRVMWFPPYDLKVNETNSAKWEENNFLGRPEPVYTYQNTSRSGTVSFKVVVDHPSILNLLVREYFKNMSDEEADNYINAFFAGCQDLDLYDLVRRFTTLEQDDITLIQNYLNQGSDSETIKTYKTVVEGVTEVIPDTAPKSNQVVDKNSGSDLTYNLTLNFVNDHPRIGRNDFSTNQRYSKHYDDNIKGSDFKTNSLNRLSSGLTELLNKYNLNPTNAQASVKNDLKHIFGNETELSDVSSLVVKTQAELVKLFDNLDKNVNTFQQKNAKIREAIIAGQVQEVIYDIGASTSTIADDNYNLKLAYRRSYSVILDILTYLKTNNEDERDMFKWDGFNTSDGKIPEFSVSFKTLGIDKEGSVKFNVVNYGEDFVNNEIACNNKEFKTILSNGDNLNLDAPISFNCRQVKVGVKVVTKQSQPTEVKEEPKVLPKTLPKTTLVEGPPETRTRTKSKKPPIDVMKRIIMKTLSECYYFKKLEEDSPVAFSSLKEKLRYFHPAFHSTTPEGLNARLTFLHQCIRPGDTIPIKGISDDVDLNARNTTFGPPPICVLRIGDFYHSKIIIRDVNITYDDSTWDLNPEGIGVQPMIANVTLQVNFIGGQGLSKPVERLQNALSSNFYANTEMYDERSISTLNTEEMIKYEQYTKEFLEEIQKNNQLNPNESIDSLNKNEIKNGQFIGTLENQSLVYTNIVNDVYVNSKTYFDTLQESINTTNKKYGRYITSLLFSNTYRTINLLEIYKSANGGTTTNIQLLGLYKKGKELNILLRGLKAKLISDINGTITSLTKDLFGFKLTENKVPNSDSLLKPEISRWIEEALDGLLISNDTIVVEKNRDSLINSIDKVNYMVYYTDHDGAVNDEIYPKLTLSGYTSLDFYKKYSPVIDYMEDNLPKIIGTIDTSINFNTPSQITLDQSKEILLTLLYDKKDDIVALYTDRSLFRENVELKEIRKRLEQVLKQGSETKFKFKNFPIFDGKKISYQISSEDQITDNTEKEILKKINSSKVSVTTKLNYYKKG